MVGTHKETVVMIAFSRPEEDLPIEKHEENNLARAKRFVFYSEAFQKLRRSLRDLVYPTVSSMLCGYIEKTSTDLVEVV